MNRCLALLFLLVGTAASACDRPACASPVVEEGHERAPHLLVVTGNATLDAQPDTLDLHMILTADADRPKAAVVALRAKQARLVKAMADVGVKDADLKLSNMSLGPIYAPSDKEGVPRIIGYRASLSATASTKEFDRIGDVMEAGAGAGATEMSSSAHRSDLAELKKKVRMMALTAAKEKAAVSAETLGVKLSAVNAVSEVQLGYGMGDGTGVANVYIRNEPDTRALNAESASLSLTVTVTYEIP